MKLAACRPSLAGRNQRVRRDPVSASAEKHGSGAEFSAAATVVDVRQRASIWHLVCSLVRWKRRRRRMALLVLIVVAGLAALFLIPGSTPRMDIRRYPNSLAVLERVPVNDTQQWILIRSESATNPVVLFVHGGPGTSWLTLMRKNTQPLEKHFTVVNYPELSRIDLFVQVPEVKIPVYFCLGRHDYEVPSVLSAKYFEALKAPRKQLVWFERSAHLPNTEEKDKFNEFMINTVLPTLPE